MRKLRVAAAATVVALIAAFASMGQATAATTKGVGTTETTSSLIDVALGTLLRVQVLPDEALATIDPAKGATSAFSRMSAIKVTSDLLGLNVAVPQGGLESKSTDGPNEVTGPAINLNSLGIPAAIASGSLVPISLKSTVDKATGTASSGLDATLANIGLAGGILSVQSVSSKLGAAGAPSTADGLRGISLKTISVLDLDTLLKGLGIDITDLRVFQVSSILQTLKLPVAGLPTNLSVGQVQALLGTLQGIVSSADAANAGPLGDILGTALGTLAGVTGSQLSSANGPLAALGLGTLANGDLLSVVNNLIPTVSDLLEGILENALDVLNGASLLEIGGIDIGAVTKAVSDPKASKADVIGKIGSVKIGGIDLGSLDLTGTLAQVNNVLGTLTSTLNGVLSPLGLDDLIHVGLFEKASNNGVTTSGGYVRSLAGITGLNISITPPAALSDLLGAFNSAGGVGEVLGGLGGTVPGLGGGATSMLGLTNLFNNVLNNDILGALAGGASIKVASVASGSNFAAPGAVASAPSPVSQLPRTGANTTVFLVIGMLMVGGAVAGRRFLFQVKADQ